LDNYSFKIYTDTSGLPDDWNVLAKENIFLSREYLEVLQASAPTNMECHFIAILENEKLMGIALSQFLDLNKLESLGDRDNCLKTSARNFVFKRFSSYVLFIGNNMLTGQNAFALAENTNNTQAIRTLKLAAAALKDNYQKKGMKIHLTSFKDFSEDQTEQFRSAGFENYYEFSIQPNMVFTIDENWKSEQDYIDSLSKKYRDQYKRARKKATGIEKRKMELTDIIEYEETIYDLYYYVAKNAPFNTFFLAKNHFSKFKEILKDKFLFYGYFIDNKMIGFNTLIKNGNTIDTYFLGYDEEIQKQRMVYLNMLYDMIAYSINNGFSKITFARTALEIKSSVGATPVEMYGFIEHGNFILNKNMACIFGYLEPETVWQQRNPFKQVIAVA